MLLCSVAAALCALFLGWGLNVHMGLFEKSFACVGIWLFMWAAGGVPSLMWVGRSLMWVGRGCRVRSCGPHFAHVGRAWVPGALVWSSLRGQFTASQVEPLCRILFQTFCDVEGGTIDLLIARQFRRPWRS